MNSKYYKLKAIQLLKKPGVFKSALIGMGISLIMSVLMSFFQDATLMVQKAPYQILSIINIFIGPILGLSLNHFFLRAAQTEGAEHTYDIGYGFKYAGKAIWLSIISIFFIVLWSLLLVVPGIIAAIRYSQAVKFLTENPELTARQALNMSKEMMKDKKGNFFKLNLSFLWWFLLILVGILVVIIIMAIFIAVFSFTSSIYMIVFSIIIKIGVYSVIVPYGTYIAAANTYFYLEHK